MAQTFAKRSYAQQLSRQMEGLIQQGVWPSGQKIPPIRSLAEQFDVSVKTAHQAIRELEVRGLLVKQANGRSHVRADAGAAAAEPIRETAPHIAMIHCVVPRDGMDSWESHIQLAAEAELLTSKRYLVTRIYWDASDDEQNLRVEGGQIERLRDQLSGAILYQGRTPFMLGMMEKLDKLQIPWVAINRATDRVIHNFVSADNIAAGRTAGRCFVHNNFRKIAILGSDPSNGRSSMHKIIGLFEAYLEADLPTSDITFVRCDHTSMEGGQRHTLAYLEKHGAPEAVFCTGDLLAMGAIRTLQEKGLSVPEDVSVIGGTGLDAAALFSPALTVVPQPMEAMGHAAVRMLLRMIRTGERHLPGKQLNGGLILRKSLKVNEHILQECRHVT